MIATEQARTAPAANEMAHSSVTSAREQAPFTPTKFAYSQNQASMLIASVTCNLGEHERLAQGSLGRWLDMGTANQHVPSKCIVCDLSKMLFPHGSWELDATITPTQRAPVTMESKADTSQVISPITAAIKAYRCAGALQVHSRRRGCTGRLDAVHPICSLARYPNFRATRVLVWRWKKFRSLSLAGFGLIWGLLEFRFW